MMMEAFKVFQAHAQQEAPRECCGLIVRGPHGGETYRPCRNVNAKPEEEFTFHHEDWDAAEDAGQILAVCHSHPGGSALPGTADLAGIEQTGLPWFILGDVLQRIDPATPALELRPFHFGWADCYALARDWYLVNRGVRLPDFPREPLFWQQDRNVFLDQFAAFGFVEVDEAQPGDLLLMAMDSKGKPNHVAVLLEGERIFDHQIGRLSGSRPLRPLAAAVTHRLRYAA